MTRTVHSRARQLGGLIREARDVVMRLPEARLLQLGANQGLAADAVRAELLIYAEREPRRALTAFARETSAAVAAPSHPNAQGIEQ